MKYSADEVRKAKTGLRKLLKRGDTVYTVLRHVSKSGMFRRISLYAIKRNQPRWLDYPTAVLWGEKLRRDAEGVPVTGCGMDMGFHLVEGLSAMLFKKRGADGKPYPDGYALQQRWM